jgi:hypothetical protein
MLASEEIYARVANVLAESLNVEEETITPTASLGKDLGAESIDFLDIVFQPLHMGRLQHSALARRNGNQKRSPTTVGIA